MINMDCRVCCSKVVLEKEIEGEKDFGMKRSGAMTAEDDGEGGPGLIDKRGGVCVLEEVCGGSVGIKEGVRAKNRAREVLNKVVSLRSQRQWIE